jgi:hypothetical protein
MQKINNDKKIQLVKELGRALDKRLSKCVKLTPFINMSKGFLEELAKQIRRLKYDTEMEE